MHHRPPEPHRFADRALHIAAQAGGWQIHGRAVAMRERGRDVIFLTIGDPDFATPPAVVAAAHTAMLAGRTHYSPVPGEPRLRAAVAARHGVDANQVTIWAGAQNTLSNVMLALVGPDDAVLVPQPWYATYPTVVLATGAAVVPVVCRPEDAFLPTPEALLAALTPSTRAILIASPGNPTGAALGDAAMAALVAFARAHELWLVHDEVYGGLTYDRAHVSARDHAGGYDRIVTIGSLSKSHAMTGWRIGWAIGPEDLTAHLTNLGEGAHFGVPQFAQDAAVVALTADLPEIAAMVATYRRRRDTMVGALASIAGLGCACPGAGMFVMLDTRAVMADDRAFADALLAATGVAVIPGSAFGSAAAGHVRITLAQPEDVLVAAAERIADFVAGLAASARARTG